MRRRLAAVLSADVVGYSTLTERDADSTLTALRRLRREVFGPAIAARRGRLVKSMGDGWLAVFDAATDAVEAAMQTQDRLVEEPLVRLRVGVHLGDVAEADEDVFGDAVNVSSRLQEMAEPGAVVISDAVYATLDGTLRPSFDDAGERALRGISRPIRLRVRGGEVAGASHGRRPDGFPRLAIVPVETGEAGPSCASWPRR
jgi:adenylate cyclase